jgi:virulence factor Mce-like protein
MGMKAPRPAAVAVALIFALSCFGFTLFVWRSFGGPVPLEAKGYRVHATFGSDAINLTRGAQVRVSGVKVGSVVAVENAGGSLDATLQLDPELAPLRADARAVIRTKTLLGETFVEITRGSPDAAPVPEGGSLPRSAVKASQTLDQVIGAFDERTRADLKEFLRELSVSLDGRGEDINAVLGNAAPAIEHLRAAVEILDRQSAPVRRLVRNTGSVLSAVGRRAASAQTLVTAGDQVLAATAARNHEVTATVRALPPLLRELRATLAALETTAGHAAPTLRAVRPAAPLVKPGLDAVAQFLPELTATGRAIDRTIDASVKGLPAASELMRVSSVMLDTLDPAGNGLAPLLSNVLPVVDVLALYRREALTAFSNGASATQWSTKTPGGLDYHYLRFLPPLINENVFGLRRRLASNRHNAYFAPRAIEKLATGLESFDCRNTSNPQTLPIVGTSGTVPCREQAPFRVRGQLLQYPHVTVGNRSAGRVSAKDR